MPFPFSLDSGGAPISLSGGSVDTGPVMSGEVVFGAFPSTAATATNNLFGPGLIMAGLIVGALLLRK